MSGTALILAAHGSRHEPSVNESIREMARAVVRKVPFDEVSCTFHQGTPAFGEVLDGLQADEITVIPIMTSAGWYSETVLPRELARNRRFSRVLLRLTAPLGLHPSIAEIIANRADAILAHHNFHGKDTTLALAGHGTPRHPASRDSTLSIVDRIRETDRFGEVIATFLDDEPSVDQLPGLASMPMVLVVPFLIAAGPHATRDLPRRMGMQIGDENVPPHVQTIAGKHVICDIPFGAYPEMIDLILDLALTREAGELPAPRRRTQGAA